MGKKSFFFIIGFLLLGLIGWYGWQHFGARKNANGQGTMAPAGESQLPAVSVMELTEQTISLSKSLPGRVSAFKQSQVRPQVNGIVTNRLFEEGAEVKKGQQLYQIDDARYRAALMSAKADLKSAYSTISSIEARAGRYEELVKSDAISHQEYDDVKAQLDQANAAVAVAKAAVEVAQVNLDYTRVYAPISGRIGRTLVTEGALVTANQEQPLAVITQLDPVYVDMQQASSDIQSIQKARLDGEDSLPVTITLGENETLPYPHAGTLKFSEVTVDQTTGSIALRAVVPNPDGVLMPGMFVRANLTVGNTQALLVPQRATTRNPNGSLSIWTVDQDNEANPVNISVSGAYKDHWIVTSGVEAGQRIIIEGYQKIAPETKVSTSLWNSPDDEDKTVISETEKSKKDNPAESEETLTNINEAPYTSADKDRRTELE